ncbi:multidrug effflux MFS transporter [Azospirillum sp. SYSU D00513]|uniref:multidrug effflux MFS transporter n=1 Tax=Azospirillum sp. SYSU D00513 TaxID=2812561 RepID=UPI001A96424A|nr:multidrug effflux MFS transporter [Azospirillum sp. SYSU D00513]
MPPSESLRVRVLLTALVALGPISTDLYLPALPTLVTVFGTDIASVQLTLSVFLVGFAVSQLVYGPLSDRFGRRPALLGGVLVYLLGSLGCMMATSIGGLIAARLVQAVGACCGPVVARAVVRDVFGRDRAASVLAYMAMAMTLAPAAGPVLGGVMTELFGWRANFALLAGFAALTLAGLWTMLGETNAARDPQALKPGRLAANYARLMRDRAFVGHAMMVGFTYSGIFAFISGSSFVLIERLKLSPSAYGLSFGTAVLGYMTGSFFAGRLSQRLGAARMIRIGTSISLAGGLAGALLAVADATHLAAVLAPFFVFLFGAAFTLPNGMAAAIGPYPAMTGLASALLGFWQMGTGAVAGTLIGHIHTGTQLPMMGGIGLLSVLAAGAYRLVAAPARKA